MNAVRVPDLRIRMHTREGMTIARTKDRLRRRQPKLSVLQRGT